MQSRTKQGLHTLRRAHAFLAGREDPLALGGIAAHVEALGQILQRLEQHVAEQESRNSAARSATEHKRALCTALRQEFLRPVAFVARYLFADDPEIRAGFRLAKDLDDEQLIQTARGFAERAQEHRAKFVAKGLAPDFVERLEQATVAFRDVMVERALEVARRAAATAGMLEELRQGRQLVRLIDLMLTPRLATHPDLLAAWRSSSRFVRRRMAGGASVGVVEAADSSGGGEVISLEVAREVARAA